MKGCAKFLLIAVGLGLVLAAVLFMAAYAVSGRVLQTALEDRLSAAYGAPVSVGKAEVGLLEPVIAIEDVVVHNPPEFEPGPAIEHDRIRVTYAPKGASLELVRLPLVEVEGTRIHVRHEWRVGANIHRLLQNAREDVPEAADGAAEKGGGDESLGSIRLPRLVVDELNVDGAVITLTSDLLGDQSVPVEVAPFTVEDVGEKPMTLSEYEVLFIRSVLRNAAGLKGLFRPAAKMLEDLLEDAAGIADDEAASEETLEAPALRDGAPGAG